MSEREHDAVEQEELPTENVESDELDPFLVSSDESEDEPEALEADGETDDDAEEVDEAEETDEAEEEQPEPEVFEVTLGRDDDGNPIKGQVTADELIAGYQRQKDYTQKTMEVAEARKAVQAEREAAAQAREKHMEALAQWAIQPQQEPNWIELAQTLDPREYNAVQAQWNQRRAQSQAAEAAYRELQAEIRAEQEQETAKSRKEALERIYNEFPEWRDKTVAKQAAMEMTETAKEYGFSDEELAYVSDDRMVRLLRDAAEFRKIKASTAKTEKRVFNSGETLRPGSKVTAKQKSERSTQAKRDRLRKTKSDDAFVDFILTG